MFKSAEDYSAFAAQRMREIGELQARAKQERSRDEIVAACADMLLNDRRLRPDFWAQFTVDYEELAQRLADTLLAHRRS